MSEVFYSLIVQGSDGKTYYVSFKDNLSWIQQRMGICELKQSVRELEEKNRKLEARLRTLEQPMRMKKILDLLKGQSQGRTERWIGFRIPDLYYDDLVILKLEERIQAFVKGKTHLYVLKEVRSE